MYKPFELVKIIISFYSSSNLERRVGSNYWYRSANSFLKSFDQQIYDKLKFPPEVQRCIVGKRMRHNKETLASCGLTYDGCVVFVYILSAETVGLHVEDGIDNEISLQGNWFLIN